MTIEQIARVCHAANTAYRQMTGDNSHDPWEESSVEKRAGIMRGVEAVLDNPAITPKDMHDHWLADHFLRGWHYGPVKDEAEKVHPCLVPYNQLPESDRVKDVLFIAIVRTLSADQSVEAKY